MELVVRKTDLLREVNLLQSIVERKNTIPILANVLMETEGDSIRMVATDHDVTLRSQCAASVGKAGRITLPAKKFFEILRALPETDVRIEQDAKGVLVAADRFESRLSTLPPEDFPDVAVPSGDPTDRFTSSALRQMVAKTAFAVSGEETRYFLNGALLVLEADRMHLVATDGHRLALVTVKRESKVGIEPARVILAKKPLFELSRLIAEESADVDFYREENQFFFVVGDRILTSRVIDAQFPAYDKVIPKTNDKRIDFDRERLLSAVKRVSLMANERSRAVRFQMEPGQVEVTSNTEMGEAKEVLVVDYQGPSMQICFNAAYVTDFLGVVETEQVTLEFKDEASQAVMHPVSADGYDYTYVIMPMRV